MIQPQNYFKYKQANFSKLLQFGFLQERGDYVYRTAILDGQFLLAVTVTSVGEVRTMLTDEGTGEPYTLYLVEEAQGAFVGSVRAAVDEVVAEISERCFDAEIFKSAGAKAAIAYVREKYGIEPEYLWEKFPNNAVWRRQDNRKWFGAILSVAGRKIGLDTERVVEVLDLRMPPERVPETIDSVNFFPAYHMNKKSWITVYLEGGLPFETIAALLDESYTLAKK